MDRHSVSKVGEGVTAVVITPTVGHSRLSECIASVQEQDYPSVMHVVVSDGPNAAKKVSEQTASIRSSRHPLHLHTIPENTGCGRYNGYRICMAFSYLVNADVVLFLDDDNWFDRNHISTCINSLVRANADWVYALRRICKEDGGLLVDDNCDSIGRWRRDASYDGPAERLDQRFIDFYSAYPFLVDTSCFAIRRTTLTQCAHLLLDGDCFFSSHLIGNIRGACTGLRTVNYRVRQHLEENKLEYFSRGNSSMERRYNGDFPWLKETVLEPLSLRRTNLAVKESASVVSAATQPPPGISSHPDRKAL